MPQSLGQVRRMREFVSIATGICAFVIVGVSHGDEFSFENKLIETIDTISGFDLGDIDGDGHIDLAFGSMEGEHVLLLFADENEITGYRNQIIDFDSWVIDVALGDIDHDGDLDLAVAIDDFPNSPQHFVQLMINDGESSFTLSNTFLTASPPSFLTFQDVEGDNDVDLFAAFSGDFFLALNDGQGGFGAPQIQPVDLSSEPLISVEFADITGDGLNEVVAVTRFSDQVNYSTISPTGQLSPTELFAPSPGVRSMTTIDLNNDDIHEIAVLDFESSTQTRLYFDAHPNNPITQLPDDIVIEEGARTVRSLDANGDGYMDLYVVGIQFGYFLYGSPTGFDTPIASTPTLGHSIVDIEDYDGDGIQDLLHRRSFSWPESQPYMLAIKSCGNATFNSPPPFPLFGSSAFASGDMNSDGIEDLVYSTSGSIEFRLSFDGSFLPPFDVPGTGSRLTVGDVDNDGFADVVILGNNGAISVSYGSGGISFTHSALTPDYADRNMSAKIADLDHDGLNDLVLETDDSYLAIRRGTAPRSFGASEFLDIGQIVFQPNLEGIDVADVNGDSFPDIAVSTHDGFSVIYLNDGSGQFSDHLLYLSGPSPTPPFFKDLNGDGAKELIYGWDDDNNPVYCYWSSTELGLLGPQHLSTPINASFSSFDVAVGDMDADGDLDIVAAAPPSLLNTWLNDGRGRFLLSASFQHDVSLNSGVGPTLIEDVNLDGHADVVFARTEGQVRVAFGDGTGVLTSMVELPLPTNDDIRQLIPGDWDADFEAEVLIFNTSGLFLLDPSTQGANPTIVDLSTTLDALNAIPPDHFNQLRFEACDIGHDDQLDLVALRFPNSTVGSSLIVTMRNTGDGLSNSIMEISPLTSNVLRAFAVGHLDNNDTVDLLGYVREIDEPNDLDAFVPLFGNGNGEFIEDLTRITTFESIGFLENNDVAIVDADNDGLNDVVATHGLGLALRQGPGDGSFPVHRNAHTTFVTDVVIPRELNGDGLIDIVSLRRVSQGGPVVYFGSEYGLFGMTYYGGLNSPPRTFDALDINNDGLRDIAVDQGGLLSILQLFGDGTVEGRHSVIVPHLPVMLKSTDHDLDGDEDLMIASTGVGPILNDPDEFATILLNHAGNAIIGDINDSGTVDGGDLAALLAQWGSGGPADLNDDGLVDGVDLAQLLSVWGTKSNASTPCD